METALLYNTARVGAPWSRIMRFSNFDTQKPDSRSARAAPVAGRRQYRMAKSGVGLVVLVLCLGWVACKKKSEETAEPPIPQITNSNGLETVPLVIDGANYTDLYIDYFSVGSRGGGNIFVSSPETPGGGGVCCFTWFVGDTLPIPVKVVWSRDGKIFCEKEVMITGTVPAHPEHIVVQFFQDGRIEVELAEDFPKVKLKLERFSPLARKASGNTVVDEQIARCHDAFH
jgi:hypothetical protein